MRLCFCICLVLIVPNLLFAKSSKMKLSDTEVKKIKKLKISKNTPLVLDWNRLYRLDLKKRGEYIRDLVNNLKTVKSYSFNSKREFNQFVQLLSKLFPEAFAEEDNFADVRVTDNSCIYAGNVSSYRDGRPGEVRCIPPASVNFCGKEYSCPSGQVPCNPMLFGFQENNYANVFQGRSIRRESNQYIVRIPPRNSTSAEEASPDGMPTRVSPQEFEVYKTPHCVPRGMDATQSCHARTDLNKGWYYNVGYMLSDMNSLQCDIASEWNSFADAAKSICDTDENRRQAQLSNEWSECEIVSARLRILHEEYASSDVGRSVPLNRMNPGFEYNEQ